MSNLHLCKTCLNRKTDNSEQIYCGLIEGQTESEIRCRNYSRDEMEKIRLEVQNAKSFETVPGGKRFLNYLLDFIAYLIISVLIGVFLGFLSMLTGMDISWLDNMSTISEYIFGFVVMSAYYIFFESLFGQSLGKMITGTKVVDENGEKASIEQIMTRTLCRFIPFEAFSFLGESAIGWHDSISKTRVVFK